MAVKKKSEKRIKKENYWARLEEYVAKYKNCLFVDTNNVSSRQISKIRVSLRAINAVMIMGKNVSNLWSVYSLIFVDSHEEVLKQSWVPTIT
jgi:hypothetical protein